MLTSGNTAATRLQVLLNANFLIRFGPQHLVRKVKYWEYNHGDGLNAEDSLELAKWLREDLASGAVKEYERSHHEYMAALPKVECPMCNGTGVRKDSIAVMYGFPDKIVESEGPWKGERGWCHVCDGHGERECDANGLRVFRAERSRIRYVPRRQRRF